MSRVCVIILNWKGWRDTIECLESLFRCDHNSFQVVICDNDSGDGSLEKIAAWAKGELESSEAGNEKLASFSVPSVPKPIPYATYTREEAETGGDPEQSDASLILIQTGGNLGFAGGNNVGLRYATESNRFDYVWLLNNDTVIEPDALSELIKRTQSQQKAGVCGSTLLHYWAPDEVEARAGGSYNKWTALPAHIGLGEPAHQLADIQAIEQSLAYIVGASMFMPLTVLKDVGLMSEEYFLYCEDVDWCLTTRLKGYELLYAPKSIVYHKIGASTASSSKPTEKSALADRYFIRNRLRLTRKFYPSALPTLYLALLGSIINRLRRRQWDRAWMILKILSGTSK